MALNRMNLHASNTSVMEWCRNDSEMRGRWILDPPYQRGSVWSTDQQRNLIRSLLLGIPTGAIIVNVRPQQMCPNGEIGAVIDGKQRITAMRAFVDGDLKVPAEWFGPDEYGSYINQIDPDPVLYDGEQVEAVSWGGLNKNGQGLFKRCTIGVCEAKVDNVEDEAAIFLLVNFGGVDQTADDRARAESVVSAR